MIATSSLNPATALAQGLLRDFPASGGPSFLDSLRERGIKFSADNITSIESPLSPTKLEPVRGSFNLQKIGGFFDNFIDPNPAPTEQKETAPVPDMTFSQQVSGSLIIVALVAAFFFLRR